MTTGFDLLDETVRTDNMEDIKEIQQRDGAGFIANVVRHEVRRPEELFRLLDSGRDASNVDDSGAHRMVTIDIVNGASQEGGEPRGGGQPSHGQLAFVFLASMEGGADPSLVGWRQCLRVLRDNAAGDGRRRVAVPTAQSALTVLAQQFFGPDGKMVHISNISSTDRSVSSGIEDVLAFGTTTPAPVYTEVSAAANESDAYTSPGQQPPPPPSASKSTKFRNPRVQHQQQPQGLNRQTRSQSAFAKAQLLDIAAKAAQEEAHRLRSPAVAVTKREKKGRRSAGAPGKTRSVADLWRQRERGESNTDPTGSKENRPAPSTPRTGPTAVSAKKWWQVMSKTTSQPGTEMGQEAASRARRKSGRSSPAQELPSSLYPSLDDAHGEENAADDGGGQERRSPSPSPHSTAGAQKKRWTWDGGKKAVPSAAGSKSGADASGRRERRNSVKRRWNEEELCRKGELGNHSFDDDAAELSDGYVEIEVPRSQRRRVSVDESEQRDHQSMMQQEVLQQQRATRATRRRSGAADGARATMPTTATTTTAGQAEEQVRPQQQEPGRHRRRGRRSLGTHVMPSPVAPPRSRRNRKREQGEAAPSYSDSAAYPFVSYGQPDVGTDLAPRRATDYKTGPNTLDHNISLFGERLGYNVQRCLDLRARVETRRHGLDRLQGEEADLREEVNVSHERVAEESGRLERTRESVEKHRQQAQQIHNDIAAAAEEEDQHTLQRDGQLARKVASDQQLLSLHRTLDDQSGQLIDARAELRHVESQTKRERAKLEKQRLATEENVRRLDNFEAAEACRTRDLEAAIRQEKINGKMVKQQLDMIAELLCGPQKKSKRKIRESMAHAGIPMSAPDVLGGSPYGSGGGGAIGGKENNAAASATPLKAGKSAKVKVLDHVRQSFESPGGNFKYSWNAKSKVTTPKTKHFTGKKDPKHTEIRMHVQDSKGSHKIVTGHVEKSVTGKGSSCTFTDVESKEVGLGLTNLIAKFNKGKSSSSSKKATKHVPRF